MIQETKCIICNNVVRIEVENIKGYQEGKYFNIYYCPKCNTSYVLPHTADNEIYDHIYSQTEVITGYNRYALFAKELTNNKNALDYLADKEAMYFAINDILTGNKDKKIKLLEVGSGLGYLTYAIAQKGYDITGLDISSNAVQKAEKRFGKHFICQDVYKYAIDNFEKFDMVILTEVIEHVPDPKGFCDVLFSLLKTGGQLIITTPNKSAFPQEEFWETELPPVHLTWFSEDSFKAIAKQKGFTLAFFDFTNFNKKHIDPTRFIFYNSYYKIKTREHVLNREGKVITPDVLKVDSSIGKLKAALIKIFKPIKPLFIFFLTHKKNMKRNSTLCVILQKNE